MRKDFVNEVAKLQRISRADLVEKDLILQEMLVDLSRNSFSPETLPSRAAPA